MNKLTIKEKIASIPQFVKFMIVGASGTVIDFSILITLKSLGLHTLIANAFSFTAGLTNNYYWNSRWTYKETVGEQSFNQFLKFTVVSLVGLGLNSVILLILEKPIEKITGIAGYGYLPAKVIATIVVLFWNYLANRIWTFKPKDGKPDNGV